MVIPRVFHHIWLGGQPMPAEYERFAETWQSLHPRWQMRMWTDETLPTLRNRWAFEGSNSLSGKANIARYEILLRYGGIYIDTDFECLKSLEPLLDGVECFVAWQRDGLANNAIIGAAPCHPFLQDLVDSLGEHIRSNPGSTLSIMQSGPYYLTRVLERHPEVTVFPAGQFYPYEWHERWRRHEHFPDAYAVHHWTLSNRVTTWPRQKQLGNGVLPCLSVVVRACDDGLRLHWVLEGLCVQTVSDFEVIVVDAASKNSATIKSLVESYRGRLTVTYLAQQMGWRPAAAYNLGLQRARAKRVLFLEGDCLPDIDVVESHAVFGAKGFVPFAFRSYYPPEKLYRFIEPLDYDGLKKHACKDPRCEEPYAPLYGDWRDVAGSCFSAPTVALRKAGGFDVSARASDQDLVQRLYRAKYRLLPLVQGGNITQLGHAG
jgi:hypothetical protein